MAHKERLPNLLDDTNFSVRTSDRAETAPLTATTSRGGVGLGEQPWPLNPSIFLAFRSQGTKKLPAKSLALKVYLLSRLIALWFLGISYISRSNVLDGPTTSLNEMNEFEIQLNNLFLEVRAKIEKGHINDALNLLKANYAAVEEQINGGFRGIEQAAILDTLALGFIGAGDLKNAEHLLNMLKEIVDDLHDDTLLLDSILMHMGSGYTTLGKFDQAVSLYARGLKIIERKFGINNPFNITPLMGMAKALGLTGRASEAVALYGRAIYILENERGTENEELAVPLSVLGNLLITEGKATDAVSCFKRIVDIYRKVYGETDGRVGMAMCSLAYAMCAKGDVNEAISMYEGGLQIIRDTKYMSVDDNLFEKMRTDLAELLHAAGR
ncbi:hypothetical protein ZIOFF_012192 [Zingiber officinale]|uniref:Uncharacterized protein n=1 Tax=Zingiber officinale TaxID=94328 RepID=A0A8J5I9C9_ZINOF|nr:hypothetical protein ZIOFF_012192 [Zingiber officinale]